MRTGIVLAGGRSTRFGGDKLLEPIDGDPLLARAIAAVSAVCDEVLVAGPEVERSPASIRAIPDAEPFGGPLLALRGALGHARGTSTVVVGGDMPELVPAVLGALLDRLDPDPSIGAVILGRTEPRSGRDEPRPVLPLAIRVDAGVRAADAALSDGRRSLQGVLDRLAWSELPAALWRPLDPEGRTLLDVDTRADLERIRAGKGH
jgi:molybdopterin-guanine dinucleotide biosynthesis protein A